MKRLVPIALTLTGCATGTPVLRVDASFSDEDRGLIEAAVAEWGAAVGSQSPVAELDVVYTTGELDVVLFPKGTKGHADMVSRSMWGRSACDGPIELIPKSSYENAELNWPEAKRQFEITVLHELGHYFCVNHPWEVDKNPGGVLMSYDADRQTCIDQETVNAFCRSNDCTGVPVGTCEE